MKPESTLTIKQISEGLLLVEAKTQYELASTFMRAQEFYESPYEEIRGRFFTHERYMDICAYGIKRSGTTDICFTYLQDWNGFNIPGEVFDEWANLFADYYLWEKEKGLIELINNAVSTPAYYIIGINKEGDVRDFDHELSHAWYYLDPEYKKQMVALLNGLSKTAKQQIKTYLFDQGYRDSVIDDEAIAYLATDTMTEIADIFNNVRIPWTKVYKIQKAFDNYKEEHFDEDN